jgi:hypothetical protein
MCIPLINFLISEPIYMKHGIYIIASSSISTAYFKILLITNTNITAYKIAEAKPKYSFNNFTNLHGTWYAYHAI